MSNIASSPFDRLSERVAALQAAGHTVINLVQGMPPFGPPPSAVRALEAAVSSGAYDRYGTNAGLPVLRQALSDQLRQSEGMDVDPDEIIITAGGNQAFTLALMTTLEAGDRVLLPGPFFANHDMALRAVGVVPVEVPTNEAHGFALSWDNLAPYVTPDTRAVVLCTPGNPTGGRINHVEMTAILGNLASLGITVITDETYMHFIHSGDENTRSHVSATSIAGWRDNVILTGSFSKSFGITGWRVGYMAAHPDVIEQAIKIQDATIICAPVACQAGIAEAVRHDWHYAKRSHEVLAARQAAIVNALGDSDRVMWTPTNAGFFAFLKIQTGQTSYDFARDLLDQAHVVTIPGSSFGVAGEGHIRVSYGSTPPGELEEAIKRIVACAESSSPRRP